MHTGVWHNMIILPSCWRTFLEGQVMSRVCVKIVTWLMKAQVVYMLLRTIERSISGLLLLLPEESIETNASNFHDLKQRKVSCE